MVTRWFEAVFGVVSVASRESVYLRHVVSEGVRGVCCVIDLFGCTDYGLC